MAILTYDVYDVTNLTADPEVRKMAFGDGYSQRQPTTINNERQKWNLSLKGKSETEVEYLRDFFDTHKDGAHFFWTPPNDVMRQFIIESYTQKFDHYTRVQTCTATIKEVWD